MRWLSWLRLHPFPSQKIQYFKTSHYYLTCSKRRLAQLCQCRSLLKHRHSFLFLKKNMLVKCFPRVLLRRKHQGKMFLSGIWSFVQLSLHSPSQEKNTMKFYPLNELLSPHHQKKKNKPFNTFTLKAMP